LENAARSDEGSLNFIAYALRSAQGSGTHLRFALTAQSETPNHALRALETEGLIAAFDVLALPPADARQAIRAMLGGLVDDALVEHVAVRSGGNPWMAGEILRALIEASEAFRYRRYWEWTRVSAGLTPSLSETLRDRAAHLSPSAQDLAATAAAIGETMNFDALLELSGRDEDALLDDLDQLIRARILLEERVGREEVYRFAHPLLRDAALEGMGIRKRRRLHARYAEILVARDADPALLAEHLLQSEQTDAAFTATLRAAKKAEALHLLPTLEHLIRRTLALLEPNDARRDVLEIYLGRIGSQIGRSSEAELFLEGVFERDGAQAMNARVALARLYQRTSRWGEAIELLEPVIEEIPDPEAWVTLTSALRFSGQPERALVYLERAERVLQISEILRAVLNHQKAEAHYQLEQLDQAKMYCELAIETAARNGDAHTEGIAHVSLGRVYQVLNEPENELEAYRKAVASFRLVGDMRGIVSAELNMSAVLSDQENFEDAIVMLEQIVELSTKTNFRDLLANAYFNLADCYVQLTQPDMAKKYLQESRGIAQEINDQGLLGDISSLEEELTEPALFDDSLRL
jgi:tetratricopeptide (TPR) repeat protein